MFGDELDDYYTDIDTARLAQELKENPSYRALLDASRTLTPKAITEVMEFIKFQKMKERGENDRFILHPLPLSVKGFVSEDECGDSVIILNSKLSYEQNLITALHETRSYQSPRP